MMPRPSYDHYVLAAWLISALTLAITCGRIYFCCRRALKHVQDSENRLG